ncbi:unnamed protein product [Discosporangium mesarthrocarpum]
MGPRMSFDDADIDAETVPKLKRTRKRRKDPPPALTVESTAPASPAIESSTESLTVTTEADQVPPISSGTKGRKVTVDSGENELGAQFLNVAAAAAGAAGTAASVAGSAAKSAASAAASVVVKPITDEDMSPLPPKDPGQVDMSALGADIAEFRRRERGNVQSQGAIESATTGAKEMFSTILSVDFFVVVGFMLWFLTGVVSTYVFKNTFILDEFNNLWTPVVQPALGLLMAGTIAGGVVSRLGGSDDQT